RIQKISGIDFDKQLLDKMDWLRKERNKAEHYQFVVTSDVLKSNIVKLFTHLIPFIKTEMVEPEFISSNEVRLNYSMEYLHEFDEYVNERLELIKGSLSDLEIVLQCPICNQETVEFNDEENAFCYFCNEYIDDFTEQYIYNFVDRYSHIMDGGEAP